MGSFSPLRFNTGLGIATLSPTVGTDDLSNFSRKKLGHFHSGFFGSYFEKFCLLSLSRSGGYKTFFMLNSVEHEVFPAYTRAVR